MPAYYNEFEPYAAQWLRNLIAAGHIAPGDVDERSIVDVRSDDLKTYTQCHFFAGIGGWSLALRLAGWSDDRSVWTGSCPCQPFSLAGKTAKQQDERHLWPYWFRLITESKPTEIFGEQVASAIAAGWWDDVATNLEEEKYACAAAVLPACGVGAPHRRDRIWFVAHADGGRLRGQKICTQQPGRAEIERTSENVPDSDSARFSHLQGQPAKAGTPGGRIIDPSRWWDTEPGVGRVADGIPARVGRLRAYGNAIVPQVAAEFIKVAMD